MREFFQPWRRKFGMATLVMACVGMCGWTRSLFIADEIHVASSLSLQRICFHDGAFDYRRLTVLPVNVPVPITPMAVKTFDGQFNGQDTSYMHVSYGYSHQSPRFRWTTTKPGEFSEIEWFPDVPATHDFGLMGIQYLDKRCSPKYLHRGSGPVDRITWIVIPYWSIVIPLATISLWLLLFKPRLLKSKAPIEPIPETANMNHA